MSAATSIADDRPCVAHVVGTFLGFTETFLYNQIRSHTRYRPIVLCTTVANADKYPWDGPVVRARRHPPRILRCAQPLHRIARLDPAWKSALIEHRASIIHGQFGPDALLAAVYAAQLGLPLITSFYGFDVGYLEAPSAHVKTHWHYILGRKALFRATSLVLALSSAMRDALERLGCPREKIVVHPNGVDLTRFQPIDRRPRSGPMTVVLCGRANEKKGFGYGFRALRRAIDRGADLRALWLPAPGPLFDELRALIEELGLAPHVTVLDPKSDPAAALREGDMMLAPSVTAANGDKEGVPTVLVEAAASGLPAVATLHAGIPEVVIDGESGILVPERDVEGLAAGLVKLAADRELRLRMGDAARRTAEATYDAAKIAARLEDHYDVARSTARLASRKGMG